MLSPRIETTTKTEVFIGEQTLASFMSELTQEINYLCAKYQTYLNTHGIDRSEDDDVMAIETTIYRLMDLIGE